MQRTPSGNSTNQTLELAQESVLNNRVNEEIEAEEVVASGETEGAAAVSGAEAVDTEVVETEEATADEMAADMEEAVVVAVDTIAETAEATVVAEAEDTEVGEMAVIPEEAVTAAVAAMVDTVVGEAVDTDPEARLEEDPDDIKMNVFRFSPVLRICLESYLL